MSIYAVRRPYLVSLDDGRWILPMDSEAVQRLLDAYPVKRVIGRKSDPHAVELIGAAGTTIGIGPATLGGGSIFEVHDA